MVGTCEACQAHISVTMKRIKCSQCSRIYHSECVRFSGDSVSARTQWKCPKCVAAVRKGGDNSNTPVRIEKSSKPQRSVDTEPITIATERKVYAVPPDHVNLINRFEGVLDAKLKTIKHEIVEELKETIITEIKSEIISLSSEFSQLQASYCQLQTENDSLKNDVCVLQKQISLCEDQLSELRSQFGKQQQQARINNLEIVGLPQTNSENTIDLIRNIARYAGVDLNHDDIEFAHRVQPQKTIAGRPKSIVVKLKDRLCKDKILSGLKRKKGICTKDIGIEGAEKRFFVNEHLTPENKQLLKKIKTVAREKAYKFVWVRNCNIFLRKNEESPALSIRSEKDIDKIK